MFGIPATKMTSTMNRVLERLPINFLSDLTVNWLIVAALLLRPVGAELDTKQRDFTAIRALWVEEIHWDAQSGLLPEVGGDTEDHYQHGVVDIEAIRNKRENTHWSHDLKNNSKSDKWALHTWCCTIFHTQF